MLRALVDRGLTVVPQVGVAGYRVDLGVLHDAVPGRFLCGIECDGVAYHASDTARDRDRLRQQVLEDRGWTIHRVWSTDWFKDRAGQIERLLALIAADTAGAGTAAASTAEPDAAAGTAESETARAEAAALGGMPPYVRPAVVPYTFAAGEERYADDDLLAAPAERLRDAVRDVVIAEAPVHDDDLVARVAGMWGTRVGSRIEARIRDAAAAAERAGAVRRRGAFWWGPADAVAVRSRTGTRIPAERIAPEEYQEAVRLVLAGGHALPREQLVTEVRALLGFARTGPALEDAIGGAIDALLAGGELGEAAAGIRKR
ncbi:Protein of unknown function DUF3320 (plasmid) [Gemmatirosa kalamazoonensis]|uniref:DUF559 domain-containing protein n=1 Tax=Gemmatirosa kalamazoonensis TaxID=861299 RepID=W0RS17_9BACT|nr:DUF3320 domain-containing protein [Gemmatirosa kalamazoonensis]AHG93501.1 Protein of unknown function DUF3320 [Gemmatirosa kalamazoonensis]